MIIITTNHKGKIFKHKYEGQIFISCEEFLIHISFERTDHRGIYSYTWCMSGYDSFWIEDVISIEGE